jgi:NAD(P)-dependent dehydrogenase (short-subunit alcohol dehydrogenase family)
MHSYVAITGAASGLGRMIASSLLEAGRPAVILDREDEQAHATADELGDQHGIQVPVIVADLATIAGIGMAADELVERFQVGGLVNNAGGWLPGDQYPDAAPEGWLSAITLNLLAPMLLTQQLWPMLSAASGAVVNIGSSAGAGDAAYRSPEYAAAKAGIRRLTASLGSRSDVRVMGVVPGWIGLDRAHREWAALTPDQQMKLGPLIPPEDVVNTVVTLLDHGCPGEIVEILRKGERTSTAAG